MRYEFRWNDWNVSHIAEHGVEPAEAEYIVRHARPPYPQSLGDGKFLAVGQLADGMYMQAIFVTDPQETLYVIHARPLADFEKRRFRRRRR